MKHELPKEAVLEAVEATGEEGETLEEWIMGAIALRSELDYDDGFVEECRQDVFGEDQR